MSNHSPSTSLGPAPTISSSLLRPRRWRDESQFQMRRIVILRNQEKEVVGYRPMIQQGTKEQRRDYYQTFRITSEVSQAEALQAAKEWRDTVEWRLGIDPARHTSARNGKPITCISLIVSQKPPYRAYWSTNQTADGAAKIRVSIGTRTYQEAYEETIVRLAQREGMALPEKMPEAPPPRRDQYKRMLKSGLVSIPAPKTTSSRRKAKV